MSDNSVRLTDEGARMTESPLLDHLAPSCEQVLETMFFTGILSTREHKPDLPGDVLSAVVEFSGPPDGKLCACMSCGTAEALASSFLGLAPDELTAADSEQVMGEMANMLCGAVLSRYAPGALLRLAAPAVYPGCTSCSNEYGMCGSFELPEGDLIVCIRVDRP